MAKVKIINGYHAGKQGKIVSKIPGGDFFKLIVNCGSTTALKECDFERIKECDSTFNEKLLKGK